MMRFNVDFVKAYSWRQTVLAIKHKPAVPMDFNVYPYLKAAEISLTPIEYQHYQETVR